MKQSCDSDCFDNLRQPTGSVSEGNGGRGRGPGGGRFRENRKGEENDEESLSLKRSFKAFDKRNEGESEV